MYGIKYHAVFAVANSFDANIAISGNFALTAKSFNTCVPLSKVDHVEVDFPGQEKVFETKSSRLINYVEKGNRGRLFLLEAQI